MVPIIGIPVAEGADADPPAYQARVTYCEAISEAGGACLLVPPLENEWLPDVAARLDGLLLIGGGDVAPDRYGGEQRGRSVGIDEERDELEIEMASLFLEEGRPILAICRGVQVLNVAAGGTLIQHIPDEVPGALRHRTPRHYAPTRLAHGVRLLSGSRLAGIYARQEGDAEAGPSEDGSPTINVNSRHHQAVAEVGAGLRPTAWAPDGVIEALESATPDGPFVVGVQWHPEDLAPHDPATQRLFAAFVAACAAARRTP